MPAHIKSLGLMLNLKKSVLSLKQRTTFLGVVWDSTTMEAYLSPACVDLNLTTVRNFRLGQKLSMLEVQRVLGLMAALTKVIP